MKRATQFVYLVGGYQVGSQIFNFARTVYNTDYQDVPLKQRLNDLYGGANGDRWALITGASEGIGREYALQLA